jgi:predicted acetyltransferase
MVIVFTMVVVVVAVRRRRRGVGRRVVRLTTVWTSSIQLYAVIVV